MDAQTLIPILETAAKGRGESIANLCGEIDANRATWQRWKAGSHRPNVDSLKRLIALAERLDVKVAAEDLLRAA